MTPTSPPLRNAINQAFQQAKAARAAHDLPQAYQWLERAHILSQRRPLLHALAHWRMLQLGWQTRDLREILGQVPRVLAALLFSRIWVPLGNTGRARVSAFAPAPLSAELRQLLESVKPRD
ncbi:MAG TPA: DUF3703 domain-containing protein [Pseudomonas sp.]|nr:DUF3703 domain-containing protein [Pseudomonas sp.]